ncbi:MAG: hypothetical protein MJZ68_02900 [archaeon]|nr:hypothetical protein [archaeon]
MAIHSIDDNGNIKRAKRADYNAGNMIVIELLATFLVTSLDSALYPCCLKMIML